MLLAHWCPHDLYQVKIIRVHWHLRDVWFSTENKCKLTSLHCFKNLYFKTNHIPYHADLKWTKSILLLSRLMTKPTKWHVRPAKIQISLGIRPVWSESSMSAWSKLGFLATDWAHSEDSDQTGRIWVFAGRTCHFVGFVMLRLSYCICCISATGLKSQKIKICISIFCNDFCAVTLQLHVKWFLLCLILKRSRNIAITCMSLMVVILHCSYDELYH